MSVSSNFCCNTQFHLHQIPFIIYIKGTQKHNHLRFALCWLIDWHKSAVHPRISCLCNFRFLLSPKKNKKNKNNQPPTSVCPLIGNSDQNRYLFQSKQKETEKQIWSSQSTLFGFHFIAKFINFSAHCSENAARYKMACWWFYNICLSVIMLCKKETIKSVNFYNLKLIEKFDGNLQMEVLIRYWIYFPKQLQYPCCKKNKQNVKDLQSFTEILELIVTYFASPPPFPPSGSVPKCLF